MDENLHNIEGLFHSALDDIEEVPSKNVWDTVDKRLDKDNIISIKRKYIILKGIALMLLLFLCIALIEINYTHKINRALVKNNTTIQGSQNKSKKIVVNAVKVKSETQSAIPIDTGYASDNIKEHVSISKSIDTSKELSAQQYTASSNRHDPRRRNITGTTAIEDEILKNHSLFNPDQQQRNLAVSAGKIKIKNTSHQQTGDEKLLGRDKNEYIDNEIPALKRLENISIDNKKLQAKDPGDLKKMLLSLASVKTNLHNTNQTGIVKTLKKKHEKRSRFSFAPFFSPDVAWYRLQNDKVGNQPDDADEIEKSEQHEFSSTIGALLNYKLNDHWALQSGVTLSNTNISEEPKIIYAQPDNMGDIKYRINTSSGYGFIAPAFNSYPVSGDSIYVFSSTHSIRYIGIPVEVTYTIFSGKLKLNAMAGISSNFLTRARLETTVKRGAINSNETVNNLRGLKKVYFSGLAGVGVDYKLADKTALTFTPVLGFALNSINKDATVKSYPMSLGFALGLKIGL